MKSKRKIERAGRTVRQRQRRKIGRVVSNHPVGPRLESSLDQVCSLRKHEGEGDQAVLRGGLQAPGPLCERMDGLRGAGEGPVTKVERRRLPERSFAQDPDGPSPAISFGRPTVCAGYTFGTRRRRRRRRRH